MFNNSFIRKKVEKAVTGTEKMLTQSMCVHVPSTCKSLCGLKACVYGGGGRGFSHLGPRKISSKRLRFKVGQNWLQECRGNKWNKDMERGPRTKE